MVSLSDKIVEASIALYVLGAVGIGALVTLFTTATTSIPATVTTLVITLVAIMFSLAIALSFYRYTKGD